MIFDAHQNWLRKGFKPCFEEMQSFRQGFLTDASLICAPSLFAESESDGTSNIESILFKAE
jgi:hypothetical protein